MKNATRSEFDNKLGKIMTNRHTDCRVSFNFLRYFDSKTCAQKKKLPYSLI